MAGRKSAESTVDLTDESVRFILSALLKEFKQRNLTASDLEAGYQGLNLPQLRMDCIAETGVDEVDYDLAMKAVAKAALLKTGPMTVYQNEPGSLVQFASFYSKMEFAYLTQDGYQAAKGLRSDKPPTATRVYFNNNAFHASQISVGEQVTQHLDFASAASREPFDRLRSEVAKVIQDPEQREDALAKLDQLQAAQGGKSKMKRYREFIEVLGPHLKLIQILLPPILDWLNK